MARPTLHLIAPLLLALQLFVSETQARRCNGNDDDEFDCDDENEDPATLRRNRIIGASVAGACLLMIFVAYLVYLHRKRRARARLVPPYPLTDMSGSGRAPPPGLPPPGNPNYGYGYEGYGQLR